MKSLHILTVKTHLIIASFLKSFSVMSVIKKFHISNHQLKNLWFKYQRQEIRPVEVFDTETYESRCINEVELINQRWNDYNQVQQFIENRDIKKNSFHLVRTNVNMKELSYIRNELATRLDENFIDSSQLYVVDNPHKCEVFKKYSDQNFLFDKSIESLSEQEKYNMRGYFRFGPILMTNDRKYAIMTYDIYHKWISSNGQHTNMETGGGGIVIVNLTGGQNIERYLHCWEY
jgi:hypothetical protein